MNSLCSTLLHYNDMNIHIILPSNLISPGTTCTCIIDQIEDHSYDNMWMNIWQPTSGSSTENQTSKQLARLSQPIGMVARYHRRYPTGMNLTAY